MRTRVSRAISEWELGVTAPTVNEIVRRRRAVTAEMALRLARYFGTTAQLWQNLRPAEECKSDA